MSDYGFSDIFSQKHSHFSFYIYFFRVFQHLMLKITPPRLLFIYIFTIFVQLANNIMAT